jgi:hypothetical protein
MKILMRFIFHAALPCIAIALPATAAEEFENINNKPGVQPDLVEKSSIQQHQESDGSMAVSILLKNRSDPAKFRKCDFYAYARFIASQSRAVKIAYSEAHNRTIAGGRDYLQVFKFDPSLSREGFVRDPESQVVKATCLEFSASTSPPDVPSPSKYCLPLKDTRGCGNTCDANDNRCKNDEQLWPFDPLLAP